MLLIVVGFTAVPLGLYLWANAYPTRATSAGISILRMLGGFRRSEVMVDNHRWYYLERGSASGTTVVMVHGFGADKDTWVGYGRLFDRSIRIISLDLPGFGDATDATFDDFSPHAQAARVLKFLDQLGIDQFHIVGSSMGGFIAAWVALDAPDRTASLTLMNAAGVSGAQPSRMQPLVEAGQSPLIASSPDELEKVLAMLSQRPLWLPAFVKRDLLKKYLEHGELWRRIFDQLVQAQQSDRLKHQLERITIPTLVVWGDADQILHVSCADVFDQLIPDSRKLILSDIGHIPMYEAPRPTMQAQLQLIRESARTN